MNRNTHVEMPDREARQSRYARINWNAHLVPVVREAVADFGRTSWTKGHALPHAVLRSQAGCGAAAEDALTIQFGVCPSSLDARALPGHSLPLVAAEKAALVFAQAASGAVAVFLYPAAAPAAAPRCVGTYRDPSQLTRARVRQLVRTLFELHRNEAPRPTAAVAYSRRQFSTGVAAGTGKA